MLLALPCCLSHNPDRDKVHDVLCTKKGVYIYIYILRSEIGPDKLRAPSYTRLKFDKLIHKRIDALRVADHNRIAEGFN